MTAQTITAAAFACQILDRVGLGSRQLPPGFAGLSKKELEFYNFYLPRPLIDTAIAKSQLHQDLWVAHLLDCWNPQSPFHQNGFFVEFGAFDGVTFSNTYLFEKQFGWKGILAEPAPALFLKCVKQRSCITDDRCVWHRSGDTIAFNQVPGNEDLATIDEFGGSDLHARTRETSKSIIHVPTVSLTDLLSQWNAPSVIDYLSVDTEGSEYEILKAFDYSRYAFRVLSVEHNFSPQRDKIFNLLLSNGYDRVSRSIERVDDMYIKADLLP